VTQREKRQATWFLVRNMMRTRTHEMAGRQLYLFRRNLTRALTDFAAYVCICHFQHCPKQKFPWNFLFTRKVGQKIHYLWVQGLKKGPFFWTIFSNVLLLLFCNKYRYCRVISARSELIFTHYLMAFSA